MALLLGIAVVLRTIPWFFPHTFLGAQEYDDGVYYAAGKALLHGQLPYRDFTIVHPPGVPILLAPFAALGELIGDPGGLAAARIVTVLATLAILVMIHHLALTLGLEPRTALIAVALYAFMPNAVIAGHTILLEPWVTVLCLAALCVLFGQGGQRRLLWVGVLLAAALSIKLFAAAYVIVIGIWLLTRRRGRDLAWIGGGLGAGLAVLVVPFVAAAPRDFWRDIVAVQLSRPKDAADSGWGRLADMIGFGPLHLALGLIGLGIVIALMVQLARKTPRSPMMLILGIAVATMVAFTTSQSYFPHYGEFLAAPLALVIAAGIAQGNVRWRWVLVGALLAGFFFGSLREDLNTHGQRDLAQIGQRIPGGSCVFAESASLAIAAHELAVPSRTCPGWIDGRGLLYTESTHWPSDRPFYFDGFTSNTRWQAELADQLRQADELILSRSPERIQEWSASTKDYALAHFTVTLVLDSDGRGRAELWSRSSAG